MTEADVNRFEASLELKLPAAYRHLLTHFPIRFAQGTSEGPVWDDAESLIKRNQQLRSPRPSSGGALEPIPANLVFIGDDGGGWQHLLDVQSDPPIVLVMEFEDVNTIGPHQDDQGKPKTLNAWFHDYLIELKNEGIDINAATRRQDKIGWGCMLAGLGLCFVAASVIALAIVGLQAIYRR